MAATCRASWRFSPTRASPCSAYCRLIANLVLVILAIGIAVSNLAAYRTFRRTNYRCGEYFRAPRILSANDGFCRKHILLSTIIPTDRFLLRPSKRDTLRRETL